MWCRCTWLEWPISHTRAIAFSGKEGDVEAGKEYFKKRFMRLSAKSNRVKEREIYVQYVVVSYGDRCQA